MISHFFFSAIGLTVITSMLTLWALPPWREALAARLTPFFIPAAQTGPSIEPLFATATAAATAAATATAKKGLTLPALSPLLFSQINITDGAGHHLSTSDPKQKLIAHYLARRYRIARQPMHYFVKAAFDTGQETNLDPLLLLAVMAVESSFNPFAESRRGAQGLMQVMFQIHSEKFDYFGGQATALEPFVNIKVGALILKDYITRGGSLTDGLRQYVGVKPHQETQYGAKVIAELTRLREVISDL